MRSIVRERSVDAIANRVAYNRLLAKSRHIVEADDPNTGGSLSDEPAACPGSHREPKILSEFSDAFGVGHSGRAARCCAVQHWPPWSRHPPRCGRPSPDPPRRSAPEPSRRPPRAPRGAGACVSSTAPGMIRHRRSRLSSRRSSRSQREAEQRHSSPRSELIPSK